MTHRHLLKGVGTKWLFLDVGVPLLLTIITGLIGHFVVQGNVSNTYIKMAGACTLALLALSLSLLVSPQLRSAIRGSLGK
jgi:hypothetical protein